MPRSRAHYLSAEHLNEQRFPIYWPNDGGGFALPALPIF